jgi:hydrogenase maturation protein HypF
MERRAIAVFGTVQGVGFRPFVHELASRLALDGFVKNQAGGVRIEVEGETEPLDQFLEQLTKSPPPLARIDEISWERRSPRGGEGFEIRSSEAGAGPVAISPDVAVCELCLAEMFDPANRRYRYPFINCTHCGPRLTIVCSAPYDRERTTMAEFVMCSACRAEYENPRDRRFHAQPIACPECGPRLSLLDGAAKRIETDDPLKDFAAAILKGQIGALKGLGGYHLVCDASNSGAVAALRQRKARDEKPLAVMVADLESARDLCEIDAAEAKLLTSSARPIVLLRKRPGMELAEQIAPGNPFFGVMLPYTPLHYLLMQSVARALVMTSGNRSDEPIAYDDTDAVQRLRGIADVFLVHNRSIHVRCDDSVTRVIGETESPIRRSRGYAPQSIALPFPCSTPLLAVGGQLKGTFALGCDRRAILSHHLGDLDHFDAYRAFERDIALYEKLFSIMPTRIAHDMHPDYASTRYALAQIGVKCVGIQHHHAHIAACMAEHGLSEPVIGVAFDGSGFGPDGAVWGGEFLIADYRQFHRAAHLRYVALPGGEQAVRQPWRMALSHLTDADVHCEIFENRQASAALRTVRTMIEKKLNSPPTSSVGRLFDAVAALCGVRDAVSYEGQAAMQLEALAAGVEPDVVYPFDFSAGMQIDVRPMIRAISADVDRQIHASRIARRFHSTLVEIISTVCEQLRNTRGIQTVALSGGVFMNALLSHETERKLSKAGFAVYRHEKVPPNDGGLCLGQLAIAAFQIQN